MQQNRIETLSIKAKLALLFGTFIAIICLVFAFYVYSANTLFEQHDSQNKHLYQKQKLISDLTAQIGYGGFIHHFKNLVIRGKSDYRVDNYFTLVEGDYFEIQRLINAYKNNPFSTSEELVQLNVFAKTIDLYYQRLPNIEKMHQLGRSVEFIDTINQIDDSQAAKAIKTLTLLAHNDTHHRLTELQRQAYQNELYLVAFLFATLLFTLWITYLLYIKRGFIYPLQNLERFTDLLEQKYLQFKLDPSGKFIEANAAFYDFIEFSNEDIAEVGLSLIQHPRTPESTLQEIQTAQSKQNIWTGRLDFLSATGEQKITKTTIIPFLDHLGEINHVLYLLEDNTQHTKNREHIEKEQAIVNTLFNNQTSLVVLTNLNTLQIEQANNAALEFLGFETLNAFHKSHSCICDLFINEETYLPKYFTGQGWSEYVIDHPEIEHKALLAGQDGKRHVFSVTVSKVPHYPDKAIANFVDITELENEKQKAELAKTAQSEFLANMSHELRTPISGIQGFAKLLLDGDLSMEQKKQVNILISSSEQLNNVVDDILDLSKIEKGEMSIVPEPENIFTDLGKSLLSFKPVAENKGLDYFVSISPELPECLVYDRFRINQILTNLLSNAIKFTQTGMVQIKINLKQRSATEAWVYFAVKDTGMGISQSAQNKVFESFKQASDSTAKHHGGTGLGLSIANQLVKSMGGDSINLVSEEGRGSEFSFTLPFDICPAAITINKLIGSLKVGLVNHHEKQHPVEETLRHYLKYFGIQMVDIHSGNLDTQSTDACDFDVFLILCSEVFEKMDCKHNKSTLYIAFDQDSSVENSPENQINLPNFDHIQSELYNALIEFFQNHKEPEEVIQSGKATQETKILLVEDNHVNQQLMTALLKKFNINYDIAENGQEALDAYKKHPYDLILMDINMPIMGGKESIQLIRLHESNNQLERSNIIALTANVMESDIQEYSELGFDGHLGKPLDIQKLKSTLANYL